ncbi:hypothetical protein XPA_005879 [Xanthoria parietina]
MLLAALASARTFTIDVTGDQVNLQRQGAHATGTCKWFGTAPFCSGECPEGWGWCIKSGNGDGDSCLSGWKWYCCEGGGQGCLSSIGGNGAGTRVDKSHDEYCDKGYMMVCPPGADKNEDCRCIEDPGDGHHRKVDEEL